MKNKEIQEKRMKDYFIQATKEILKGEGLKCVSVRNVAERAGYSYATLYNYFKDINDLIFYCISDFQEECNDFVKAETAKNKSGIELLKATVLSYINYFVEYPGTFELFYLTKVSDFGTKGISIDMINTSLDRVCEKAWDNCVKHNLVEIKDVELKKSQLKYAVIGLLVFYLNRRNPDSYTEFIQQATLQIDTILSADKSMMNNGSSGPMVQNSIIALNL